MIKTIRLMADYGDQIWFCDGSGPVDINSLPISDKLKNRILEWGAKHDSCLNWSDPLTNVFSTKEEEIEFFRQLDEESKKIHKLLKQELAGKYRVLRFSHALDGAHGQLFE